MPSILDTGRFDLLPLKVYLATAAPFPELSQSLTMLLLLHYDKCGKLRDTAHMSWPRTQLRKEAPHVVPHQVSQCVTKPDSATKRLLPAPLVKPIPAPFSALDRGDCYGLCSLAILTVAG